MDELLGQMIIGLGVEVKELDEARKKLDDLRAKVVAAGASAKDLDQISVESGVLAKKQLAARRELDGTTKALHDQRAAAMQTGGAVGALNKHVEGLATRFGALGIAGAAVAGAKGLIELDRQASAAENVLGNLKFSIDAAKDSTLGLVDSIQLGALANKAGDSALLGNEDAFARVTGAVTKLAISQNKDLGPALEGTVQALVKGETEALSLLGVTVDVDRATKDYAQSIGKLASELTEQERKTAKMIAGMAALEKKASAVSVDTTDLASAVEKLGNMLGDLQIALLSNAGEMSKSANEITVWDRALAGAKDRLLQTFPPLTMFADHTQKLNEQTEKANLLEDAKIRVREGLEKQTRAVIAQEEILLGLTIKLQAVQADAALKRLQANKQEAYDARIEDAKIKGELIHKVPPHLRHLSGRALQAALESQETAIAAEDAAKPRGKREKKKAEFHLTDFEHLLASTLGPGFELGKVPGIERVKLDRENIRPQSVVNVTNNDIDIAQTIEAMPGTPEEIEAAAMAAAHKEFDARLKQAAPAAQVNQAV